MKPRQKTYLAYISDNLPLVKTTEVVDTEFVAVVNNRRGNKKIKVFKEKTNFRHKMFCKCGFDFEIKDLKLKTVNTKYDPQIHGGIKQHEKIISNNKVEYIPITTFETPIVCPNCQEKYYNYYGIIKLETFLRNIVSVGVKTFEKNKHPDLIKLSFFQKNLGVSNSTKKLFSKFFRTSLIFNKKTKTFFRIKNDNALNKVGISILDHQITGMFNSSSERLSILFAKEGGAQKFHEEINKFIFILSNYLDGRDREKIKSILQTQLVLKEQFDINQSSVYYKNLIIIYISLIYYPSFFTILLMKGVDFYLDFISTQGNPPLKKLKKLNLTNPYDIIEYSIKHCVFERKKESEKIENGIPIGIPIDITKERIDSFHLGKQLFKKISSNRETRNYKKKLDLDVVMRLIYLKNFSYDYLNSLLVNLDEEEMIAFIKIINSYDECDIKHLKHLLILSKTVLPEKEIKINTPSYWLFNNNPYQQGEPQEGVDDKYQYHNFDLYIYRDIFRVYDLLEIDKNEIFQYKTWKEIVDIHDELALRIKNVNLDGFTKQMRLFIDLYSTLDKEIDFVKFETIKTAFGLEKEGQEMNHCVGTYISSVANGECVIIKVKDIESEDRATMELRIVDKESSNFKFSFSQLKAKYNQRASKKIIEATMKYLNCFNVPTNSVCNDLFLDDNENYIAIIPQYDEFDAGNLNIEDVELDFN